MPTASPTTPTRHRAARSDRHGEFAPADSLAVALVGCRECYTRAITTIERGSRLGPYEIVETLGSGGMGEVFRARDTRLDRSVAIKILPPEFAANAQLKLRFEREARTISQLNHPNICTVHDIGHDSSIDYLVMELCEGQSLAERLQKGPLPPDQALRTAAQIADALDRAHRNGIVHRDLKPGNIMLTRSGAKLLDFGLAKEQAGFVVNADERTARLPDKPITEEGTIVGTIQYMAPEQFEGAEADARSDIFSFGAVLYEMVTGRRAFEGKTRASVIASILERDPVPLPEILPAAPAALERLVKSCLEKSPDDRWQNAHDLKREIEWLAERQPEAVLAAPRSRKMRAGYGAALVLLPLLAAAGTYAWLDSSASSPRPVVSMISPPRGTQFVVTGDAAGPVTLSPDGRLVTFVASGGGEPELWIQSLDTGAVKRVPGTGNAMFPFWSPDSRSIGFFAEGRLLTIEVDGSTPRQIGWAPEGRGATWIPDGRIIFAPHTQTGLFITSASGGEPAALTTPSAPWTTHRFPAFLPDGKHIIYLAANHGEPSSPDTAIFVSTLDGGDPRKLLSTSSSGIVYGEYLLFVRSDKLHAQKIRNGELTGPVIPLYDRVLTDPGTWRSIISASAGLLAMHGSGTGNQGVRLVWLDGDGRETGQAAPPGIYRDIAISPDGQKLALTIGDPQAVLYVDDLRRGVRSRLSFRGSTAMPVWTPDGRSVIFQQVTSSGRYDIVIKPADGSAEERTIFSAPYALQPSSVDAARGLVLFNALEPGNTRIMAAPLAAGNPIPLVDGPGQELNATISPDGRWLAYLETNSSGRYSYVTTYPQTGPKWQVSEDAARALHWTDGGKALRYVRDDGPLVTVPVIVEAGAVQFGTQKIGARLHVNTNRRPVASTPDGTRFVAATIMTQDPGPATLVVNFDEKLR